MKCVFLQTNKCTFTTRGAAPPLGYRFPPAAAVNYHRNQCQLKMRRSYTWGRVCIPEINHTDLLGKFSCSEVFSLLHSLTCRLLHLKDLWSDSDRIWACSKTQIGHVLLCAQVSGIALPLTTTPIHHPCRVLATTSAPCPIYQRKSTKLNNTRTVL